MPKSTQQANFGRFGAVIFDGGAKPSGPYIPECEGGGVNLNPYMKGNYPFCVRCSNEEKCLEYAASLS